MDARLCSRVHALAKTVTLFFSAQLAIPREEIAIRKFCTPVLTRLRIQKAAGFEMREQHFQAFAVRFEAVFSCVNYILCERLLLPL